jgi:magnesium-protoporphyrin O-methyltransferase
MTTVDNKTTGNNKTIDDKTIVREYFNATGFDRWQRIYGDGEVNNVQLNIRKGHQLTIDKVLAWFKADGNLAQITLCDAGCGVGSLAIPAAQGGARVYASDISEKMVGEAKERAAAVMSGATNVTFETKDLEEITGRYHTVVCLDVLIHYPPEKAGEMILHLASLADSRLILSFAPKTWYYDALKKIGDFFPGPSKATRAYTHPEAYIVKVLEQNGWKIARSDISKAPFYFSRLLEAVKA